MPAETVELYDYAIHEGDIGGQMACALLWQGKGWPYQGSAGFRVVDAGAGYQDLLIVADEGQLLLKSTDRRLLQLIIEKGLYVIFQDENGVTQFTHMWQRQPEA
ncbi:hypothetical protein [Pseudomonas sp.]|uniref:hypothetical protein n=1 Tax=Pseudomonas sp. TaxID=306 RepID=UPI00290E620D|nr:hypothetical protein [Pseudomonas sp.]MDU4254578.1 hypothetical protein [Pseudomonas sp.]